MELQEPNEDILISEDTPEFQTSVLKKDDFQSHGLTATFKIIPPPEEVRGLVTSLRPATWIIDVGVMVWPVNLSRWNKM